ncbi:hypothetical protein HaLaN_15750 [Haematococcus lacustris]|uniref:Uncharacterized protein n=1 Tax=Haematococcus lacustris TaxID=44745 RepID=A0A699ZBT9_HAELA|nr:hypothetical protein HaLaN_15750 [Haematococcus lacustris]
MAPSSLDQLLAVAGAAGAAACMMAASHSLQCCTLDSIAHEGQTAGGRLEACRLGTIIGTAAATAEENPAHTAWVAGWVLQVRALPRSPTRAPSPHGGRWLGSTPYGGRRLGLALGRDR